MRQILRQQMPIVHLHVDHDHAKELAVMSLALDKAPRIVELIFEDLTRFGSSWKKGRVGMTDEQVLRAIIIKQMNGFSYQELAFHLADSRSYRTFCRLGIADKAPSRPTLQRNIKKIRAETMEAINKILILQACDEGIEKGKKIRIDCTGIESNIHEPSDSSLLWDCVRVLTRQLRQAARWIDFSCTDHSRRAKRRFIAIRSAKKKKRTKLYRDLLKVTQNTIQAAEKAVPLLENAPHIDLMNWLAVERLAMDMSKVIEMAYQVVQQTQRRVLHGESVPAEEKLVSIFEPHTDIIKKDKGHPLYGHKLCLTSTGSGLFTDCVVEKGNPADSTLAVRMIERQITLFGRPPLQATYDGGFASNPNLQKIKKELDVKEVVFSKRRGMRKSDMARSTWVYKRLRDFRAGIEGMISFLKRCFGLRRCTWKGLASFKTYVWSSIVSANLLLMARHMLK